MIDNYFNRLEDIVCHSFLVVRSNLNKIKLDDFSGIIKGRLYFEKGILDFLEVITTKNNPKLVKMKYKYHFMNAKGDIIFRYDNVPHHREIVSFPHHKHLEGKVIDSHEPNLNLILNEIKNL